MLNLVKVSSKERTRSVLLGRKAIVFALAFTSHKLNTNFRAVCLVKFSNNDQSLSLIPAGYRRISGQGIVKTGVQSEGALTMSVYEREGKRMRTCIIFIKIIIDRNLYSH